MRVKYRFYLTNESGVRYVAHPVFSDEMALQLARENGEQFFRKSLSQSMTFVRDDFEFIISQTIDTEVVLICEYVSRGTEYSELFRARFTRIDCEVNYDDNTIKVTPQVVDEYTDILDGIENEYDLAKLNVESTDVQYHKRAITQLYALGDNIVQCFVGAVHFETECEAQTNRRETMETYHWQEVGVFREIDITNKGAANGAYRGKSVIEYDQWKYRREERCILTREDGAYYIQMQTSWVNGEEFASVTAILFDRGRNPIDEYRIVEEDWWSDNIEFDMEGGAHCKMQTKNYLGRIISDEVYNPWREWEKLAEDDMVGDNRNYHVVITSHTFGDIILQSGRESDTPTRWGKSPSGRYYLPPSGVEVPIPISRSQWGNTSYWYDHRLYEEQEDTHNDKEITLRNCYPVGAVIKTLLNEIAPDVTHEMTEEYSTFLYRYDIDDDFGFGKNRLLIAPKSNVIVSENTQSATKAIITLRQVLSMLADVFQCYWHIEDGKLRIEHISWYKNGGSYDREANVGYDLTELRDARNGKPLAYHTSKVTYDKESMPQRYEFKWSDDVSSFFVGEPIVILSNNVKKDQKQEVNVQGFTSDLDYILANPNNISQDGYVLIATNLGYQIQNNKVAINGASYYVQNGVLSYAYLQPKYWTYDMPSYNIEVNGERTRANGVKRTAKQNVTIPVDGVPDMTLAVKTYLGNGQYDTTNINLSSLTAQTTLRYDAE